MSSPPPIRAGDRPRTTPTNPHTQLDQQPVDLRWVEELARRLARAAHAFARPA